MNGYYVITFGKMLWPIFRYSSGIHLEILRKVIKTIIKDIHYPD
jgi:hypothetical protein